MLSAFHGFIQDVILQKYALVCLELNLCSACPVNVFSQIFSSSESKNIGFRYLAKIAKRFVSGVREFREKRKIQGVLYIRCDNFRRLAQTLRLLSPNNA
jgi:hypothetical protein